MVARCFFLDRGHSSAWWGIIDAATAVACIFEGGGSAIKESGAVCVWAEDPAVGVGVGGVGLAAGG